MNLKTNFFLFGAFIALALLISFYSSIPDGKLHLVFCDVGQGDAIYLKFPDGSDGLVDGGFNSKVLDCLGKHMTFWDKKIEIVFLTHPDSDHLNGLLEVVKRYQIETFVFSGITGETQTYQDFEKLLKEKNIAVKILSAGNIVQSKDKKITLKIIYPVKSSSLEKMAKTNNYSLVSLLSYHNFDVLLPGDLEGKLLEEASTKEKISQMTQDGQVEVFKAGHHGSKQSLTENLLKIISPKLVVISVGKNNLYGHPDKTTVQLLQNNNIKYLRTDEAGTIEILSDGKNWQVEK